MPYRRKESVFRQGETANAVFYVQEGAVRLSVTSASGKEAVVGVMAAGDFFGEGCLAGQTQRMENATAIVATRLLIVDKKQMVMMLKADDALSERFIAYLLARNIRLEEDLVDQLFNCSEKRLARALLLLVRYGMEGAPLEPTVTVSQEILAEMVGTTRSRVSYFMNKFRRLGFIDYHGHNDGIRINAALLSVVLQE